MNKKILVAAGGTGGHIYPALAVARELKTRGYTICWLANRNSLEERLALKEGFEVFYINVTSLRRASLKQSIISLTKLALSLIKTCFIFLKIKPSMVIVTGGYVSGPAGIIAKVLRVPLVVHEQNKIPGMTNKVLARFSSKVLESFPSTYQQAVFTGNPIREDIMQLGCPKTRFGKKDTSKFRLLILGGSQGANSINKILPKVLSEVIETVKALGRDSSSLMIWHQTGSGKSDVTQSIYDSLGLEARVEPFIEDMQQAYAFADLIVARAGATTIAEICGAGIASILIPYPLAADNHQYFNAQVLVNSKAASMVLEEELETDKLKNILENLVFNHEECLVQAQNAKSLAKSNATVKVVEECIKLIS